MLSFRCFCHLIVQYDSIRKVDLTYLEGNRTFDVKIICSLDA